MPVSKFIRVALSGKTVDGREITPDQIDQMAASYDPKVYGARVNLEHYLSFMPNSDFRAYGDVIALKSEDAGGGQRALLAQVDATDSLVLLNKSRQKIYWSIEMNPNFAGTGKAYMMGLAATDTPASLGTEVLKFALTSDKAPQDRKAHLFTESLESALDLDEPTGPNVLERIRANFAKEKTDTGARFAQVEQAIETVAAKLSEIATTTGTFASAAAVEKVATDLTKLSADLAALTTTLSLTPDQPPRGKVAGADSNQTDC